MGLGTQQQSDSNHPAICIQIKGPNGLNYRASFTLLRIQNVGSRFKRIYLH